MMENVLASILLFAASFVATLALTPLVREVNRRLGMVDKPDPRRINKVPIPRGGGISIVICTIASLLVFRFGFGYSLMGGADNATIYKMLALALAVALVGLVDDRFSLPPRVKLLGQVIVAVLVWAWAGLGFRSLWPFLPVWLDCLMTVFWIVGAVNAFNLIDGLDGLASGLALIAVVGMAGSLLFIHQGGSIIVHIAFAGALLGFLRYNYNPASVFLGDCGSMFIGFMVCTLPLLTSTPNSFLVSVGVPLLAMGVPIFDTSLAILRRSIRRLLSHGKKGGEGQVMTADSDHLHHRILRSSGFNQRKAAWVLYGIATGAVMLGLIAMLLQSKTAGLWLGALTIAAVVIFKDSKIELFDAGRLLSGVVHSDNRVSRRRISALTVPFYLLCDVLLLSGTFLFCAWTLRLRMTPSVFMSALALRVASVFVFLVFFRVYRTVWSRAVISNYVRLFMACVFGSVLSSVVYYYWPETSVYQLKAVTIVYALLGYTLLLLLRVVRGIVRDFFYALDCARLRNRKDVVRILVYGTGLRYRAFRRELVRTTAANDRMIVGLVDDDICLKGRYVGGIRIYGTINEISEIVNETNADALVIACEMDEDWLEVVKELVRPTGIKVTVFGFEEKPI